MRPEKKNGVHARVCNLLTWIIIMIDEYSRLIVCGGNRSGQCGIEGSKKIWIPTINRYFNKNNIKIKDIETEYHQSICIDNNCNCYIFGEIDLGFNTNENYSNAIPNKLIFDNYDKNIKIINISCGYGHNMLLSDTNNVIGFGLNNFNQCSSILKDELITKPYIWNKNDELGIDGYCYVDRIIAMRKDTIVIINPFKTTL